MPNDNAVDAAMDFMNLGQFDMLAIPDFPEIMQYHAVPGVWTLEDLEDGMTLTTVQGQALAVTVNAEGTFVDGARIVQTGFEAFNGVAHVIDEVLAPSGLPAPHVWAARFPSSLWRTERSKEGAAIPHCSIFALWQNS